MAEKVKKIIVPEVTLCGDDPECQAIITGLRYAEIAAIDLKTKKRFGTMVQQFEEYKESVRVNALG